jgi:hypothetical protein
MALQLAIKELLPQSV